MKIKVANLGRDVKFLPGSFGNTPDGEAFLKKWRECVEIEPTADLVRACHWI